MTEREAIHELSIQKEVIESMLSYNKEFEPKSDNSSLERRKKTIEVAIQALNEIQQYRKIGTVEEIKKER